MLQQEVKLDEGAQYSCLFLWLVESYFSLNPKTSNDQFAICGVSTSASVCCTELYLIISLKSALKA